MKVVSRSLTLMASSIWLLFFFIATTTTKTFVSAAAPPPKEEEICHGAWAHDDGKDRCAEPLGFESWGWSNGRYGLSGCEACECPYCPTEPPSPSMMPTKAPTPPPVPLPRKCMGFGADIRGDPHIRSFDGLNWDCQGEGEFQILKSLKTKFQIQGRFLKFNEKRRPTVTKSVVWQTANDDDDKIQITAPNTPVKGSCKPIVYVNNIETDVDEEGGIGDPNVQTKFVREKKGAGEGYIFYYHDTGFQITVKARRTSSNGCVLFTKLCIPEGFEDMANLVGLVGTPDNNKKNDWMDGSGKKIDLPKTKKQLKRGEAYKYCTENWCVQKDDSIFHYLPGESHAKFSNCGLPADEETYKCMDDPPKDVKDVCGLDNENCLVDGCAGDAEDAKLLLDDEMDALETECGREVFFEDFDTPYAHNWGDIEKGKLDSNFLMLYKTPDGVEKPTNTFSKVFMVPAAADMIQVEFFFFEIGDWEGATKEKDWVHFFVGETPLDLLGFEADLDKDNLLEYHEGYNNGVSWSRMAVTNHTDMGFGSKKDQMHRVTVNVPPDFYEDGKLKLSFLVTMTGKKKNEAAGVDDFRITAYGVDCSIEEPIVQPTDVNITEVDLPLLCDQHVATIWGDPHINSFDGVDYDCQGTGEFTLVQSYNSRENEKTGLEMQGRFERFNHNQVTVMRAIAIKDKGEKGMLPTVQLEMPSEGECKLKMLVGGEEFPALSGYKTEELFVEAMGSGAVIVFYPKTKLQVIVLLEESEKLGCFLAVKICIPDDIHEGDEIFGLLGSADENGDNEWVDGGGIKVPTSPKAMDSSGSKYFENSYKHCTTNWCIRSEDDSLFTYEEGKGHDYFMKCDDEYEVTAYRSCTEDPPKEYVKLCGECMACIVDYCAGGSEDGKKALTIQTGLFDERGCGFQLLFQNFQDNDAKAWGYIDTQPGGQKLRSFRHGSEKFGFTLAGLPDPAKRIKVEFLMHDEGGFDACEGSGDCAENYLVVTVGTSSVAGHHASIGLDMFGVEDITMGGVYKGIRWTRQKLSTKIHRVELEVPKQWFQKKKIVLQLKAVYADQEWIGRRPGYVQKYYLGIDDFRMTAYANRCGKMKKYYKEFKEGRVKGAYLVEEKGRQLESEAHGIEFFDTLHHDDVLEKKWNERHLSVHVKTDECTCICPPIDDGEGDTTVARTLDLYLGAEEHSCTPLGDAFGTVTLTPNFNKTITVTYTVPAGYSVNRTIMYSGAEVIPGIEEGRVLNATDFPEVNDHDPAVTTYTYYDVDPLSCDFYLMAYAEICGPFPAPQSPTLAPTTSPSAPVPDTTPAPSAPVPDTTPAPSKSPDTTPAPSKSPDTTPAPSKSPSKPTPGSSGDPHVMDWSGMQYDFHGACDLVLLHNPGFANGLGMEIHIRTEIDTWWSYIKTAVLRIGDDTFEVMGGAGLKYWINGKAGKTNLKSGRILSKKLAGEYKVLFRWMNDKQHTFKVDLGNDEHILFKTFRQFVRVQVEAWNVRDFLGSSGLMGSFPGGVHLARDNSTVLDDPNMMGQEWQVLSSEPKLFHNVKGPQHPQKCTMPTETVTSQKRRLGEAGITREQAEKACAHVDVSSRKGCIFDVLSTQDLDMAQAF